MQYLGTTAPQLRLPVSLRAGRVTAPAPLQLGGLLIGSERPSRTDRG